MMRLASFKWQDKVGFGVVGDREIRNLAGEVSTLRDAIANWGMEGLRKRAAVAEPAIPLEDVEWLPPITNPDKILCIGLNYFEHAKEAKMAVPERPSIFVRFPAAQVGHLVPVVRPGASTQFDYEAELAVVIGKPGRHVDESRAHEHIAGFSCFAENSVRDWQTHSRQATPGKNFENSGAFGPWLVTPDEAGPVEAMEVVGRLNGAVMQRDRVSNMIFSVPQLLAYASTFITLLPGDVIVTGTPAGVGFTRQPPVWLRAGDRFEVEVTGVGLLSNPVIDERNYESK
jgi:2-keto-4-pentenoate hydratase/2-oxohepta-3-ene-1,7-dioic acid hydratase in catechol pathway